MIKQTISWTVLPNGATGPNAAGTKLNLSVFVAPRLWNDDPTVTKMTLDAFPDFLDWPATVGAATYEVSFNGGPPLAATVPATAKPLRSDYWKALFKDETTVVPFRFENMTGAGILTVPATVLEGLINDIYTDVATDPACGAGKDLPPRGVLATRPGILEIADDIPPRPDYVPVPVDERPVFVGTPGPELEPPLTKPGEAGTTPGEGCGCGGCLGWPLALLRRFMKWLGFMALLPFTMGGLGGGRPQRDDEEEGPVSAKKIAVLQAEKYIAASQVSEPLPTDLEDAYDFHQMIASLGDYPNLLRYLGLVIDLEVTLDAPLPANGTVTVTPSLPLAVAAPAYTPRTHYELAEDYFQAQPGPGSDLREGLLRVDDPNRFRVMQLDVMGSTLKLRAMANKLVNEHKYGTVPGNEPEKQGLPALQTVGISIARPELGAQLRQSFLNSWAMNAKLASIDGSPTTPAVGGNPAPKDDFFAEDLVRGYRVDVFDDKSARWHSLCRRVGTYRFGALPPLTGEEDEGFVQMSVTEPAKASEPRELRVHESLFTWNGWSLGAPRYGKTILSPSSSDPDAPTEVGTVTNDAVTQFDLETAFEPKKGSLPRLRFGYNYRLRVRGVDLAGNSVFGPDDDAFKDTQAEVTPEVKYRRFEPVAPPMVMLQAKPVEGESLERLVVRSRFDDPVATIEAQETARHLVPPKTSQLMAEHHRKFDGTPAMDKSLAAYQLAGSEAGSLMERVNPLTGDREPIPGAVELNEGPHTFWIQTNDTFDLSYLPDPYARGVLLLGLPGMTTPDEIVEPGANIINKIPFDGPWPNLKPMRLRVQGIANGVAPALPNWDAVNHLLTVQVPQGETYEVQIRSYFKETDLDNMAIWKWTADKALPQTAVLRAEAVAGRNWLHLPARTLVLVHAVQQPLAIPEIDSIKSDKKLGDTLALLTGKFKVDAKSTGKVDVEAEWEDPFDNPPAPFIDGTSVTRQRARLAEVRLGDPKNDLPDFTALPHALGDTRHHEVTYTPVASTRYREYFPPTTAENLIRPTPAEVGVPTTIDILNSARPDAPKPQYMVPTFQWQRTSAAGIFTTVRRGGGLRVYMNRPWYSSGKGELLGVVLKPAAVPLGSDQAELLKKFTSEWGMDPLWPASATFPLFASTFIDPAAPPKDVRLAELQQDVTVVGYKPEFDAERDLWFCDILLEPGTAYFPFVRLALVRFQPKSVDGAHISNVVMADFIQVVPHRDVKYDLTNVDATGAVEVEVRGPAYVFNQDSQHGSSQMIVRLERRSAVSGGDELGWEPIASQVMTPIELKTEKSRWRTVITTSLPRPVPLRVVVLEVEMYAADTGGADALGVLQGLPLPGMTSNNPLAVTRFPLGYRVTFADAVEVP